MKELDFLIEDKIEEVLGFLTPLQNNDNVEFNPYFSSGPEEDINVFLATEQAVNIYPLIWLAYPYKEQRNSINVTAENLRLIIAIENNNEMLNKLRLEGSYKKALYPLFYNIRDLFEKARNFEVIDKAYTLTKHPNYGMTKSNFHQQQKSQTTTIWDALTVDFGLVVNKFCHGLKK